MNRWSHPVQYLQQTIDRHEAYIKELHKTVGKIKNELERLEQVKADRKGRKPEMRIVE